MEKLKLFMKKRDKRIKVPRQTTFIGYVLLTFAAVALGAAIYVSYKGTLTPLESTLLTSITFILSTTGSVLISAYFSQKQARSEYEQLARPSLRRIASLERASTLLADIARKRQDTLRGSKTTGGEELMWLTGLANNIEMLRHQINDAIADWRELLPDEYEESLQLRERELSAATTNLREAEEKWKAYEQEIASLKSELKAAEASGNSVDNNADKIREKLIIKATEAPKFRYSLDGSSILYESRPITLNSSLPSSFTSYDGLTPPAYRSQIKPGPDEEGPSDPKAN